MFLLINIWKGKDYVLYVPYKNEYGMKMIYLSQHDIKANKINVLFHDYILNSTTECHY
jgi:hypothetical protein